MLLFLLFTPSLLMMMVMMMAMTMMTNIIPYRRTKTHIWDKVLMGIWVHPIIISITIINNIFLQVVTPKSTFLFDVTFPLSLFNGPLQPVIYILAFSKLRKAFWELFCPLAKNRSLNTAVDAPVRVTMVTMEMKPSCRLIDIREMASINNWSRGIE